MRSWFIRLEWKPQDLWVGVFWKTARSDWLDEDAGKYLLDRIDVWVCILPMVPIHFGWHRA